MKKENLPKVLEYIIGWGMFVALIFLAITSAIIQDYKYIVDHPLYFTAEMFMFAVVPATIVFLFIKTRGVRIRDSIYMFLLLTVKFGLFHLFFQLSGVYTLMFWP